MSVISHFIKTIVLLGGVDILSFRKSILFLCEAFHCYYYMKTPLVCFIDHDTLTNKHILFSRADGFVHSLSPSHDYFVSTPIHASIAEV